MDRDQIPIFSAEMHEKFMRGRLQQEQEHLADRQRRLLQHLERKERSLQELIVEVRERTLWVEENWYALKDVSDCDPYTFREVVGGASRTHIDTYNGEDFLNPRTFRPERTFAAGVQIPASFLNMKPEIEKYKSLAASVLSGLDAIKEHRGSVDIGGEELLQKMFEGLRLFGSREQPMRFMSSKPPKQREGVEEDSLQQLLQNELIHLEENRNWQWAHHRAICDCEAWIHLYDAMHNPPMTLEKLGVNDKLIGAFRPETLFAIKGKPLREMFKNKDDFSVVVQPPTGNNFIESLLNPDLWKGTEGEALKLIAMLPKEIKSALDQGLIAYFVSTEAAKHSSGIETLSQEVKAKGKKRAPE